MTYSKTLARAAGLGLCVAALSGTALADPGNGNGGPATTPPGQEQKAETPAASAPAPAAAAAAAPAPAPQASHGQEQKAENQTEQAERKAEQTPAAQPAASKAAAAKAAAPGQAKKAEKQAEHKPAKVTPQASNGRSADAHHHVIVCHRTGSESNPYVVINIPWTAWTEAHSPDTGSHPDLNDRHDILLKDPASRPGSKDGFTKADCESRAGSPPPPAPNVQETQDCPTITRTETVVVGVLHATGAFNKDGTRKYVEISPSEFSAHIGGQHPDDRIDTRQVTTTVATGAKCDSDSPPTTQVTVTPPGEQLTIQPTVQPTLQPTVQPVGGVAGAVSPAAPAAEKAQKAAKAEKPAGGVLGAVTGAPEAVAETATSGTLPFTGIPLWIAALLGAALLATGLVLRRSST